MGIFDHRSHAPELMDDLSARGEEIARALDSVGRVNRWLGGIRVLLDNLEIAFSDERLGGADRPVTLVDVGCGSGDGLRAAALWARHHARSLILRGVDANPFIVEYARTRSREYPEIEFEHGNVLDPAFDLRDADIVTFNLFLHHFRDPEIVAILEACRAAGVRAVLINDLHRHWLAYTLFPLACAVFRSPRIARVDGLLSIRRAFRRHDLVTMTQGVDAAAVRLRWRWAFRYQLVLRFPGRGTDASGGSARDDAGSPI